MAFMNVAHKMTNNDKSDHGVFGGGQPIQLGRPMRQFFQFDDDYVNLNHGSFGACPVPIQEGLRSYQAQAEARPDQFVRYDLPRLIDQSRALLADYLHARVEETVLVPNATTGINTVLRNLTYAQGDTVVYGPAIYGACEKTVAYICETTPARSEKVNYTYPIRDSDLVSCFRDAICRIKASGGRARLAIFEVVASLPGVRMPFEQLTAMCRQESVLSVIDGAHAPGQVPLNLDELQPDFFIGNCHKWLFAPRACAVLYVPLRHQQLIRSSLPTSHGFVPKRDLSINNPLPPSTKSEFISLFEFTGALDVSPYLCIPQCFQFIDETCGGEARIIRYCTSLARSGGATVAQMLGTEAMENDDRTLQNCFFSNVRLPLSVGDGVGEVPSQDVGLVSAFLSQRFVEDYNTFMAVVFHGGAWWVRLSASIYLEEEDFSWAGSVLQEACNRVQNREYRDLVKIEQS